MKRQIPDLINCLVCEKEFRPERKGHLCCSRVCGTTHAARFSRKDKISKPCESCGKEMSLWPCKAETRFCSVKCRGQGRRIPRMHTCKGCGAEFYHYLTARAFCSTDCRKKNYRGPLSSKWKGGITGRERALFSGKLTEWRNAVFLRDSFTCVKCGNGQRGNIHAHHIKPWKDFKDLRFDVSNGETLCLDCHGVIHNVDFHKRENKRKTCKRCGCKISGKGKLFLCRKCCSLRMWENRKCA
jgi:hypothetical protein